MAQLLKTRPRMSGRAQVPKTPKASGRAQVPKTPKASGRVLELGPLEYLFPCPRSRILDFMLVFRDYEYPVPDIARYSGTSLKTARAEMGMLEAESIVARAPGRAATYRINKGSPEVRAMYKLASGLAMKKYRENHPA